MERHDRKKIIKSKLTDCPICSSRNIKHKYTTKDVEYNVVDPEFDIYVCEECKTYFINPVPDENKISKFYNFSNYSSYGAYKEISPEIEYTRIEKWLINKRILTFKDRILFSAMGVDNRILDLLTYMKSKQINFQNVLDVGCGSGFFIKWLIKFLKIPKSRIKGIDIFPRVEKFGEILGIEMKCATSREYPESGFDLITLSHVLEHEPKPKMMIKRIYDRLSKDGIFYLSVPNSRSLAARAFGKKWICHSVPRHVYNFSKKSITEMTKNLFRLEYYSAGRYYTFILNRYYESRLLKSIFANRYITRILDSIFLLFNIGDNQSFIFTKNDPISPSISNN